MVAGVNIFRLNFSHGDHKVHGQSVEYIHKLNRELGLNTGILADLSGPKIRTGIVETGSLLLSEGETWTFSSKEAPCRPGHVTLNYPWFAADVQPDELILLDDGKIMLKVTASDGIETVKAQVIQGGLLSSRKGVNLPDTILRLPSLSEKDLHDLDFIMSLDIHWVALSFVRKAADIEELRTKINSYNKKTLPA